MVRHLRVPLPCLWGPTHSEEKHPPPLASGTPADLPAAQGSPNTYPVEKLSLTRSSSTLCTKPL